MPGLLTLIGLGNHAYLGKAGAHEFKIRESGIHGLLLCCPQGQRRQSWDFNWLNSLQWLNSSEGWGGRWIRTAWCPAHGQIHVPPRDLFALLPRIQSAAASRYFPMILLTPSVS